MIQYIGVKNYVGIESVELDGLSKINVISGRNNSGKSTILRAIQEKAKSITRINVTGAIFGKFSKMLSWQTSPRSLKDNAIRKIKELEGRIWLSDEQDYLCSELIGIKAENEFADSDIRSRVEEFKDSYNSILIESNRNIESVLNLNTNTSAVLNQTATIISTLFKYKNSSRSDESWRKYCSLEDEFFKISGSYFDVVLENNNLTLNFLRPDEASHKAESCGYGLRQLLSILAIDIFSDDELILLLDEPENNLHPELQRKLLYYLTYESQKQCIIATHSNIFLDSTYVDKTFFVYHDGSIKVKDVSEKSYLLNNLGYSIGDNLTSDLVILVEGPSDKPVIEEFLLKMSLLGEYNIKIWPLGGDIMAKDEIDLSVFSEDKQVVALVDKDPGSKKVRDKFVEKCNELGIPCTVLDRYSTENYFTLDAIKKVFVNQVKEDVVSINPNKKLEEQIGINVKKKNGHIAKEMSLEDIEGTDLMEFFESIKDKLERNELRE